MVATVQATLLKALQSASQMAAESNKCIFVVEYTQENRHGTAASKGQVKVVSNRYVTSSGFRDRGGHVLAVAFPSGRFAFPNTWSKHIQT